MVVPDTLLRHLAPAREWPLCAHTSCSNNTLHIYESGRDAIGIDLEWNLDGIDLDTIELELI